MAEAQTASFKGLWIPAELWMDETLNRLEIEILADVLSFDTYYKTNASMAQFFRVSERRIQQTLTEMEKKGLIERTTATGSTGRTVGRAIKVTKSP